jgi:hypothetical protein
MTENAIPEQVQAAQAKQKPSKSPNWQKAKDSRGRPITGLWVRNGRFAFQMWQSSKNRCVRVPLMDARNEPVKTVAQAVEAMNALKAKRKQGVLPVSRKVPTLGELVTMYLADLKALNSKKSHTIACESSCLRNWVGFCGSLRLHAITPATIHDFSKARIDGGKVGTRAVNLDVQMLRNALKYAKIKGYLSQRFGKVGSVLIPVLLSPTL